MTEQYIAEGSRYGFALAIHGGAGTISRNKLTPDVEAQYRDVLLNALQCGRRALEGGGSAVDAVVDAVVVMEDSPLFNAGRGAVFSASGVNELDASIMVGRDRSAGAVAGMRVAKNPIVVARAVMERSAHVMLQGEGADDFAKSIDCELADSDYFYTEARWRQLQRVLAAGEGAQLDHDGDTKYSTVGAVALDARGDLAAATSTGGMTGKRWGRVGDSPIIGAGTYASNDACAVSATGHGEYFIRAAVAYDICARMAYQGRSLAQAAEATMADVAALGGTGGVIAVDRTGAIAMPFSTAGMYRGYVRAGREPVVAIFAD